MTPIEIGNILFDLLNTKPKFKSIPTKIFSIADKSLAPIAFFSPKVRDTQQFLRIAKYYATESMLFFNFKTGTYDDSLTPDYGEDRLEDHFCNFLTSDTSNEELGAHKLY